MNTKSVIIIGAGACGLSLAHFLNQQGKSVTLIEKSKSVGGRMATRRQGEAVFDHGAQFYRHSSPRPIFWHDQMQMRNASRLWFKDEAGVEHYVGNQGITQIAKALRESCHEFLFSELVIKIVKQQNLLQVVCSSGATYLAEKVVLTCPIPQSLDILKASGFCYPPELEKIQYAKALVGLFETQNEVAFKLGNSAYINPKGSIFSVANNYLKKISPVPSYTVVMNPEFSETHFDVAEDKVTNQIESLFQEQLVASVDVTFRQLKKWRFSHPETIYSTKFCHLSEVPHLFLGGDAFGGGSINGAVQSALAIGQYL
ncbi:MAG: NAD(P)/FAD-dependent oxidoreductase [Pseudobdellovibrionaceae bacterium]